MPKQLPSDLLEQVQALLLDQPEGLTLASIEKSLQGVASRRSLQRRLDQWTRKKLVHAQGVRRGRRYFSPAQASKSQVIVPQAGQLAISTSAPEAVHGVPLSVAAQKIQAYVRGPLADRTPIGYQRRFIEKYVPNESAYLPDVLKTHLYDLGRTPDGQRPAGTYAREIVNRLLIDLSWSSSRLEGNTYSLLDTRELIEKGTVAPGKDAKETQMILNHKAAIELLVETAEEVGVNRYTITNLHALLSDNLLDDQRNAGRVRQTPIAIGASTYIPTAIPQLIEEMFTRLLELGTAIRDPFEQSFFLMVHIPYLQPFVDVNKRTSRLAANIPLVRRNLVPLSFIDVPEQLYVDGLIGIYEMNRVELLRDVFVWAYERSARQYRTVRDSLPEPDQFRLRYRAALGEVVGDIVRRRLPLTDATISNMARQLVDADDIAAFIQLVQDEVAGLHDGNIARFRLRPSEFRQWQNS